MCEVVFPQVRVKSSMMGSPWDQQKRTRKRKIPRLVSLLFRVLAGSQVRLLFSFSLLCVDHHDKI
jgi:hypothetical protein